jgi:hypothetical protein
MNALLLLAAGLCLFTFCVHTFGGSRFVVAPFEAQAFDPFAKATLRVVWHMATWTLALMSVGLLWAARGTTAPLGAWVGALAAGYAVLFIAVAQRVFSAPIRLPQWLLLGPLALFALAGGLSSTGSEGRAATAVAVMLMVAIAAVHAAWAFGAHWPSRSREELALAIIGHRAMPGPLACFAVAAALLAMAAALVASVPSAVRWGIAAPFFIRGTVAWLEPWLRPSIRGTPYRLNSAMMYTPHALCIGVAIVLGG